MIFFEVDWCGQEQIYLTEVDFWWESVSQQDLAILFLWEHYTWAPLLLAKRTSQQRWQLLLPWGSFLEELSITSLLWHYGVTQRRCPFLLSSGQLLLLCFTQLRYVSVSKSAPLPQWSFPAGASFPSLLDSSWGFPPETSMAPRLCSTREICRKDSTLIHWTIFRHPKLAEGIYLEVRAVGTVKGSCQLKRHRVYAGPLMDRGLAARFPGWKLVKFNLWIGRLARFQAQLLVSTILKDWLVGWFQSSENGWFHVQLVRGRMFLWLWSPS